MKVGRNDPCPCGSGKKYKLCCDGKDVERQSRFARGIVVAVLALIAIVVVATFIQMRGRGADASAGRVWSPDHGHYHDADDRH